MRVEKEEEEDAWLRNIGRRGGIKKGILRGEGRSRRRRKERGKANSRKSEGKGRR